MVAAEPELAVNDRRGRLKVAKSHHDGTAAAAAWEVMTGWREPEDNRIDEQRVTAQSTPETQDGDQHPLHPAIVPPGAASVTHG